MLDVRDPAIKLFGKTIPVAGDGEECLRDSLDCYDCSEPQEAEKELEVEGSMESEEPDDPSQPAKEESSIPPPMTETDENQKESDSENQYQKAPERDSDEMEANDPKNLQQKPMKKPGKILPCPRCNSTDTKFCYYNNYNVNQPRYFCKSCQRYWTAGGSMRNVPVGAGRRKNKNSASRYAQMSVSEGLQAVRLDGVHSPNGKVLNFGSDTPLCESMASVLNIADKNVLNGTTRNGFGSIVPCHGREARDERSSGSTVTTTSSMEDVGKIKVPQESNKQETLNGFSNQMPCFQWPFMPFMWNPAVHAPVPPFFPSGYPMPFYPAPYWNAAIPWNVPLPWVQPSSPGQKSLGSNPNSPTLGKHSREGEILNPNEAEKSLVTSIVLVPNTLRIDDPDEAAKSSIWKTLGIQKEKGESNCKGGFFNSFQTSKPKEKDQKMDVSPGLNANPAALCRSVDFQERS